MPIVDIQGGQGPDGAEGGACRAPVRERAAVAAAVRQGDQGQVATIVSKFGTTTSAAAFVGDHSRARSSAS